MSVASGFSKIQAFIRSKLHGATGRIPGRIEGKGAPNDVKAREASWPLIEQVFGPLPALRGLPAKRLDARKARRGGVDRTGQYRDANGEWHKWPTSFGKTAKGLRKLGHRGSWRSPSLKTRAIRVEHAARVRAGLEDA